MKRGSLSGTCRDAAFERILPRGDTPADGHTLPGLQPGRPLAGRQLGGRRGVGLLLLGSRHLEARPFIPRPEGVGWDEPVFSPDGALIALSHSANQIRLREVATGRTIAHLTTLQALAPRALAFSPDGTRLIASTDRQIALIWDLRRIRERLRTMDLDWDQPPYPPEEASPGLRPASVRTIRVLGEALEPAARRAAELAACESRLREHPDDIEALLDRGWLKLQHGESGRGDPRPGGAACGSGPTTPTHCISWRQPRSRRAIGHRRGRPWRSTWCMPEATPMPAS